jgi:hypothetical protein
MKKLFLLFSLVFVFLVAQAFAEDSALVEAAKKEKARRAELKKPAKVLTNQDIEKFKEKNPGAEGQAQTSTAAETNQPDQEANQQEKQTEKKVPLYNDEKYWRDRAQGLSDQISELEKRTQELQSDINALWMAGTASDNGQQTVLIGSQRAERMEELKQAQQQLDAARQAQENLQEEARKEGALPGWVTPQ